MKKQSLRIMDECSIMIALAVVLDMLCKMIPGFDWFWGYGGSISVSVLPILFLSYRHGWKTGLLSSFIYSLLQMVLGFYPPPVQKPIYFILCILLDYVIGFSVFGLADLFARPFRPRHMRLGYVFSTVFCCLLRFHSSFLSGILVFNSNFYVGEGEALPSLGVALSDPGAWIYSLTYNGSYMLANTILNPILIVLICMALDPKTLRRPVKPDTKVEEEDETAPRP